MHNLLHRHGSRLWPRMCLVYAAEAGSHWHLVTSVGVWAPLSGFRLSENLGQKVLIISVYWSLYSSSCRADDAPVLSHVGLRNCSDVHYRCRVA